MRGTALRTIFIVLICIVFLLDSHFLSLSVLFLSPSFLGLSVFLPLFASSLPLAWPVARRASPRRARLREGS